jgi:hypothetical protein
MKYSRISRAESKPVSASGNLHCRIREKSTRLTGEQHLTPRIDLFLACMGDFRLYPRALHAGFRKNEQKPVVDPYCVVKLLMNLFSCLDIVRSKPAAHAVVLQISIKAVSKIVIVRRIADEA